MKHAWWIWLFSTFGFSLPNCSTYSNFSCYNTSCDASHISCFNISTCSCVPGHLWRTGDIIPCSYTQKSLLEAALLQGIPILILLNGCGECYLGNTEWCIGQMGLSFAWWCACCFFLCRSRRHHVNVECWIVISIIHMIWWAFSLILIATGRRKDGNGCGIFLY